MPSRAVGCHASRCAWSRPNLDRWRAGNDGVPGFVTRDSAAIAGPHVVVVSLVHGNELAGAIVVDRLLAAGLRP